MRALGRRFTVFTVFLGLLAGMAGVATASSIGTNSRIRHAPFRATDADRVVPGRVLVRMQSGESVADAAAGIGGSARALVTPGWREVRLPPGLSVDQALAKLRADPRVADVSADHVYQSLAIPNDTFFGLQWGLRNTGQEVNHVTGTAGADIHATSAWDKSVGSPAVIVAVVDSGVATDHPDLAPNIDFADGWDFVDHDSDPYDELDHGTHVAGIIGAVGNDGYGVSGVAPHVKIMPLRALDDNGSGSTLDIAAAFDYAAKRGAKIVNASLGGSGYDPVLKSAIDNNPGTLYVVAAGNAGLNNDSAPTYPCSYSSPNLICVAASDQNDHRATFSNYGSHAVDLAAPGVNIASTYLPDPAGFGGNGYALADSPNGAYANGTDSWAQPIIDLTGQSDCSIKYRLQADLASGDKLIVESSADGSAWTNVDSYGPGSTSYTLRSATLPPDQSSVRFRLTSDGTKTDDGALIDNLSISCGSGLSFDDNFNKPVDDFADRWTTGGTSNNWGRTDVYGVWAYMDGTSMATPFVAGAAALAWSYRPTASVPRVKAALLGSVDARSSFSGKTVSGGRLNAARALVYVADTAAPSGVSMTGSALAAAFQRSQTFTAAWKASDSGSGVKNYDVRYQRAKYNSGFGSWNTWRLRTSSTSGSFTGAPGYTYCFQVRARDGMANASGWSSSKCAAIPVDDRSLSPSASWVRHSSSAYFLGTYSSSASRGAWLKLGNVSLRRISLLVTTCNTCGSVDVYRGSTLLGTFSLYSPTTQRKQLITVKVLSSVAAPATVMIRIHSSSRQVLIDGLALSRV